VWREGDEGKAGKDGKWRGRKRGGRKYKEAMVK